MDIFTHKIEHVSWDAINFFLVTEIEATSPHCYMTVIRHKPPPPLLLLLLLLLSQSIVTLEEQRHPWQKDVSCRQTALIGLALSV